LCAIVCYYDMHRYYCLMLKSLLAFNASPPITNGSSIKLHQLSSQILSDRNLIPSLIDALVNFTVVQEFERLNNPRTNGLGGQSHQDMIAALIKETEQHCYEIICLLALYGPAEIQKDVLVKLFESVHQFNPRNAFSNYQLTLWTALLLVINPARLKQQCDGSVEIFKVFKQLLDQPWKNPCLKATVQFAFSVSIKYARNSLGLNIPHEINESEMVEEAVDSMAIESIHAFVAKVPKLESYTFSVDVMDSTIKNFICYFREKLNEMYNVCEDERTASSKDEAKTFSKHHFKALVELITALFTPTTPQLVSYSEQFMEPKFEALCNFTQLGKSIASPSLTIAYMGMLNVLCKSQRSSNFVFNMFK